MGRAYARSITAMVSPGISLAGEEQGLPRHLARTLRVLISCQRCYINRRRRVVVMLWECCAEQEQEAV